MTSDGVPARVSGNKAIEDAAVRWVIELERLAGREPRDACYAKSPVNVESPPRSIEAKAFGTSNRGFELWLEVSQIDEARRNTDFYIYVVENVRQRDPQHFTLKVLGCERLQKCLARAREHRYYTLPWPVAEYDSTPNGLQ